MNLENLKKILEKRIEFNKSIISQSKDTQSNHDLEVENTSLEFVLMLIRDEEEKIND